MGLFLLLALLGGTLAAEPAPASGGGEDVPSVEQARIAHVESVLARAGGAANAPGWQALGHWRPGRLGTVSDADGADFFLASNGRVDPAAELEATIRGFYREPTAEELRGNALRVSEDGGLPPLQHPVCRFPARLRYLVGALGLDLRLLPVQSCPKLADHFGRAAGSGASIVFSDYHAGNAGSVFGHTFLRVHRVPPSTGDDTAALLDDGINFGAVTGGEGPLLYAIKGLTGLYPGRFSRLAYFYKVREYGDFESRDLWEYPLDLTPDEVWMLVAHVWELDNTWFAYFFRTENCSDQVLALLQAARPGLSVRGGRWASVLPAETVRDLTARVGARGRPFAGAPRHRPSLRAQFEARAAGLDTRARAQVASLAEDPAAPVSGSPAQVARVLDAAADLIDMRFARELVLPHATEGSRRKQALLARRAALAVTSPEVPVPLPAHGRPDVGHGPARLAAGVRVDPAGATRFEAEVRPMLHGRDDPPAGYPGGTAIEMLSVRVSVDPRATGAPVRLEDVGLLHMRTLEPVSRFSFAPSRQVDARVARLRDPTCASCLALVARGGAGLAADVSRGVTAYAFALTEAQVAPELGGALPARGGPLASVGLRWVPSGRVAVEADAVAGYLFGGVPAPVLEARVTAGVQMGVASALLLDATADAFGPRLGARVAWYR